MVANVSRRDTAKLTKEYVVSGFSSAISGMRLTLPWSWDDLTREFGRTVYEKMMLDAQIASNVSIFKASIIEEGLTIAPNILTEDLDGYEQSKQIADECCKMFEYMDSALDDVLWDMMDQVIFGHKVAEIKYFLRGSGANTRLDVKDIVPKPLENTAFVVDSYMNVIGMAAKQLTGNMTSMQVTSDDQIIPRNKFLVFSFRPKNKDPRGSSLIRTAYDPWWRKRQVMPEYMKFLAQFAAPSLIGKTPENAIPDDSDPDVDPVNPVDTLLEVLLAFRNSSALVVPHGTEVDFIKSEGSGEAFRFYMSECNHDITKAILTQELATEESKFQARAAAQVHQGILDTLIRQSKRSVIRAFKKDVIIPWIYYNWGEDAARNLCPSLTLGATRQAQLAPLMTAIAALERAGFIHDEQRADIDKILGLPVRPKNDPKPVNKPATAPAQGADGEPDDEKVDKVAAMLKRNLS